MQLTVAKFTMLTASCLVLITGCQLTKSKWESPEYHFAVINQARRQIADPELHAKHGFQFVEPAPSLSWLAENQHIQYCDLVLPNVDRRAGTLHWMKWGEKYLTMPNPKVVWIQSNMHHDDFAISGKQPLHFQIWYQNDAKNVVVELIKELEALPK